MRRETFYRQALAPLVVAMSPNNLEIIRRGAIRRPLWQRQCLQLVNHNDNEKNEPFISCRESLTLSMVLTLKHCKRGCLGLEMDFATI